MSSLSYFKGEILIIYEKEVEILGKRPKKPIWAYPGCSKCKNSKTTPFRGSFSYLKGEILIIYEKQVEILDYRSKKPIWAYPGCKKYEIVLII